jgi:hypothetical protein
MTGDLYVFSRFTGPDGTTSQLISVFAVNEASAWRLLDRELELIGHDARLGEGRGSRGEWRLERVPLDYEKVVSSLMTT